jgi:pimeloyl-ACP methyl ester carboxylesterase
LVTISAARKKKGEISDMSTLSIVIVFIITALVAEYLLGKLIRHLLASNLVLRNVCSRLLDLFVIVAIACGILYIVQDDMIFYYAKDENSRIFLRHQENYLEVKFTAENGKTYNGMLHQSKAEKPTPLVIYFGGNGQASYNALRGIDAQGEWGYFNNYSFLCIDYEGYGLNEGHPHYLNMYEEALAIYDYAVTLPDVDPANIVAMGYSLGTGCANYLAANREVTGLVLVSPYESGYDLYNNVLPIFYGAMRHIVKQKLPSDEFAPMVAAPVLMFASKEDEVIPYESSQRLSELFPSLDEFVTVDWPYHIGMFNANGVYAKIQAFLEAAKLR